MIETVFGSRKDKQMIDKPTEESGSPLATWIGQQCTGVDRHEYSWGFGFGNAGGLNVQCPWRIIADARIAVAGTDDGQQFGLPEPLDAGARARALLLGKQVTNVRIDPVSADLHVVFGENAVLELFNNSSGYEGWLAVAVRNGKNLNVIAQGGGAIAMFEEPERPKPRFTIV
jgi:hypothetical protein